MKEATGLRGVSVERRKEMGKEKCDIGNGEVPLCAIFLLQSRTGSPFIPEDVSKPSLLLAYFGVKHQAIGAQHFQLAF